MRASQNAAQTTFPLLGHDLIGLGAPVIGDVAAASSCTAVVVMLVIAARIPTAWARATLAVALVVMAAGLVLLAVAEDLLLFVAGALVLGTASGVVPPILMTVVSTTRSSDGESAGMAPGSRDRPLFLLGLALSASLIFGPFAETVALDAFGGDLRRAIWAFVPVLLLGASVAGALARAEARRRRGRSGRSDPLSMTGVTVEPPRAASPGPDGVDRNTTRRRISIGEAWASWRFRVALLAQVLYAFPFVGLVVFGALL